MAEKRAAFGEFGSSPEPYTLWHVVLYDDQKAPQRLRGTIEYRRSIMVTAFTRDEAMARALEWYPGWTIAECRHQMQGLAIHGLRPDGTFGAI